MLCSDGRHYSRYLAPKVLEAWKATEDKMARTKKGREKIAEIRAKARKEKEASDSADVVTESVTESVTEAVAGTVTKTVTERRSDDIKSEEIKGNGIVANHKAQEREGRGLPNGGRQYEAFEGVHFTRPVHVVHQYAKEFPNLADTLLDHLKAIDVELSLVPEKERTSRIRPMLKERNEAAAKESEALPF